MSFLVISHPLKVVIIMVSLLDPLSALYYLV